MMNIREARIVADSVIGRDHSLGQYWRPKTLRRAFARLQLACDNPTAATSETGWLEDNKRALAIWDNTR